MAEVLDKVVEKEPFFGTKEKKLITDPLNDDNPVTVQVLGVCSALAVTGLLFKSLVMGVAVIFVVALSNYITSLVRNLIPSQVRMISQLVIIASLVTIVELALKALNFQVWKDLSVYIGLIITNCIVMGRLEAFAMANKPWRSFLDGIGNGAGYALILVIVAFFRELFGKGTLMAGTGIEMKIIGPSSDYFIDTLSNPYFSWYYPNNMMVLPASALFVLGIIIWVHRSFNKKLVNIS